MEIDIKGLANKVKAYHELLFNMQYKEEVFRDYEGDSQKTYNDLEKKYHIARNEYCKAVIDLSDALPGSFNDFDIQSAKRSLESYGHIK